MSDEIKLYGVDISHWQGNVNMNTLKNDGCVFVFHKATDGCTGIDDRFKERLPQIMGSGLIPGAYCFYEPITHGNLNGDVQANHLVDTVIDAVGVEKLIQVPLICDFEKYGTHPEDINDVEGGQGDVANLELFFTTLRSRLAQELNITEDEVEQTTKVLLYSYHQWLSVADISPDSILMKDWIKLWGARYYKLLPVVKCGKPLFIWQQSDSKPFQGLSGMFDFDIVMCTPDEWNHWVKPLLAQATDGHDNDSPGAKPEDENKSPT